MMHIGRTIRMLLWLTILLGGIYPCMITLVGYLTMPKHAKGSLVYEKGSLRGSKLLAQAFESEKYFWPRPSAIAFDTLNSGGSNLGPISKKLIDEVENRRKRLAQTSSSSIPSELLYASGSGLDPHILLQTAYYQISRVAKARGMSEEKLKSLIDSLVEKRHFGFLGRPKINVLMLNIALDNLHQSNTE